MLSIFLSSPSPSIQASATNVDWNVPNIGLQPASQELSYNPIFDVAKQAGNPAWGAFKDPDTSKPPIFNVFGALKNYVSSDKSQPFSNFCKYNNTESNCSYNTVIPQYKFNFKVSRNAEGKITKIPSEKLYMAADASPYSNVYDNPNNWGIDKTGVGGGSYRVAPYKPIPTAATNILLTDDFLSDYDSDKDMPNYTDLPGMVYSSSYSYGGKPPVDFVRSEWYSNLNNSQLFSIDGNSIVGMNLLNDPDLLVLQYIDKDKGSIPKLLTFSDELEKPAAIPNTYLTQFNPKHLMSNKLLNISLPLEATTYPLTNPTTIKTSTDFIEKSTMTHSLINSGNLSSNDDPAVIDKNVGLTVLVNLNETSSTLVTKFDNLIQQVKYNFGKNVITLDQGTLF